MSGDIKIDIDDVKRINYNEGDVIGIFIDPVISWEQKEHIVDQLGEVFPGTKVLVFDGGVKVGVIGKGEP